MLDVVDDSSVGQQRAVLVDAKQRVAKCALDCSILSIVKQSAFNKKHIYNSDTEK